MSTRKSSCLLSLFLLVLLTGVYGLAQQPVGSASPASAAEVQLLRALLDEVQRLRLSVQHNNETQINTYRAQAVQARLTLQQARVDGLTEEIEHLKALIQQASDTSREEAELKEMEELFRQISEPNLRAQRMQELEIQKRSLARQQDAARQEADRHRLRLAQLHATHQQEQSRRDELQGQLDALDRDLAQQLTDNKKTR